MGIWSAVGGIGSALIGGLTGSWREREDKGESRGRGRRAGSRDEQRRWSQQRLDAVQSWANSLGYATPAGTLRRETGRGARFRGEPSGLKISRSVATIAAEVAATGRVPPSLTYPNWKYGNRVTASFTVTGQRVKTPAGDGAVKGIASAGGGTAAERDDAIRQISESIFTALFGAPPAPSGTPQPQPTSDSILGGFFQRVGARAAEGAQRAGGIPIRASVEEETGKRAERIAVIAGLSVIAAVIVFSASRGRGKR